MDTVQLKETWAKAAHEIKATVINPQLWRAVDQTIPVTAEGNFFVVGLEAADSSMLVQMNTGQNQMSIQQALRKITGNGELILRVIEGTTLADWDYTKQRDAAANSARQQTTVRQAQASTSFGSWDDIYNRLARLWSDADNRMLPTGRARYVEAAFVLVEEAAEKLLPPDGKTNEQYERGLSRVLERIGSYANTDPATLAYLLFQRKK